MTMGPGNIDLFPSLPMHQPIEIEKKIVIGETKTGTGVGNVFLKLERLH